MQTFDLVVVGTGWFGLVAAKVYLELHPTENICILEAANSCGGTWAEERLYPDLKSNNLYDAYEYPDFPMDPNVYGVQPGHHIPGPVLHRYLTDFAKKFGVFSRTQFNTRVDGVSPGNEKDTWQLQLSRPRGGESIIDTRRLIIATGLTSTPNIPDFVGSHDFRGNLFHAKDFRRNQDTISTSKHAVVIGGAKSAYDVAYAYAAKGVEVDMVVRAAGNGPVWIAQPYVDFGLRLEKLLQVRALTCFNPCPWGAEGGYEGFRNWLHGTNAGRWLVDKFWANLAAGVVSQNGFRLHPETQKLEPWQPAFWTASGLSIHNYDQSFFDMVKKGKIRIHISDIDHLSQDFVHLKNGQALQADVVCCGTGWSKETSIKFHGLPVHPTNLSFAEDEQRALEEKFDREVLKRFPRLKEQPNLRYTPEVEKKPLRLYRFIVPPTLMEKRNIAFAGMVSTTNTAMCASSQALWISAFFDGKLDRIETSHEGITNEIMLHTQFGKWRYPCGYGARLPDFAFDGLPYMDLLGRDLGLQVWRKPNAFKELFAPYGPPDFRGMVMEWAEMHRAES